MFYVTAEKRCLEVFKIFQEDKQNLRTLLFTACLQTWNNEINIHMLAQGTHTYVHTNSCAHV